MHLIKNVRPVHVNAPVNTCIGNLDKKNKNKTNQFSSLIISKPLNDDFKFL